MSIFGTTCPKIIVDLNSSNSEVLLEYGVVLKDEPVPTNYHVKAIRTGTKYFTNAGKHWIFVVKIHLWKYEQPDAKYIELKSYEGTKVILYKRSDGDAVYDQQGNPALFYLSSATSSYTDDTNKLDVLTLTFISVDRLAEIFIVPRSPENIADLVLWFADDTLENPSANNFVWTDKVSGTITLSGNYGTGDGLTLLNGKTVLHSEGDIGTTNQLSTWILNYPAFTFIGLIQKDLPQGEEFYTCHIFQQQNIIPRITFSLGPYVSGGGGSNGLLLRAQDGFSYNQLVGLSGVVGGANADTPPHKLTLISVKITYGTSIVVNINGTEYSTSFLRSKLPIVHYVLNSRWNGLIGEFMYYSRTLTNSELNYLGRYYRNKYGVDWTDI